MVVPEAVVWGAAIAAEVAVGAMVVEVEVAVAIVVVLGAVETVAEGHRPVFPRTLHKILLLSLMLFRNLRKILKHLIVCHINRTLSRCQAFPAHNYRIFFYSCIYVSSSY